MNRSSLPVVGITLGDPNGVGPEIVLRAVMEESVHTACIPVIIGDFQLMQATASRLNITCTMKKTQLATRSELVDATEPVLVYDLANVRPEGLTVGKASPVGGMTSYQYVDRATALALDRHIDAIATAPISKEALDQAGLPSTGHTEILASLTRSSSYTMMLTVDRFRVAHVSTHVSLVEACRRVTKDRVLETIELFLDGLRRLGVSEPHIGVAGLNPHAGEGGLFGTEEVESIIPAIKEAQRSGIDVTGPYPPDTIFVKMQSGALNGVVAMYHDQGHIPTKLIGFEQQSDGSLKALRGTNVTLGLPIVRTSVDHGVAYDIAGQGIADHTSMAEAIEMAAILSTKGELQDV